MEGQNDDEDYVHQIIAIKQRAIYALKRIQIIQRVGKLSPIGAAECEFLAKDFAEIAAATGGFLEGGDFSPAAALVCLRSISKTTVH